MGGAAENSAAPGNNAPPLLRFTGGEGGSFPNGISSLGGPSNFAYGQWRAKVPHTQPFHHSKNDDKNNGPSDKWIEQMATLPTLAVRCWVEFSVSGGSGGSGVMDCGLAIGGVCKRLMLCDTLLNGEASSSIGGAASILESEGSSSKPSSPLGAVVSALAPPLLKHIAPHVPLNRFDDGGGSSSSGGRRRSEAALHASRKLDASLVEAFCMLLSLMPPAAMEAVPRKSGLPTVATLSTLCRRLGGYLCTALANGGSEVAILLRGARLLLASGWAEAARKDGGGNGVPFLGLPRALLELWEGAPLHDPTRHALLKVLRAVLMPLADRYLGSGSSNTAGVSAPSGGEDAIDEAFASAIVASSGGGNSSGGGGDWRGLGIGSTSGGGGSGGGEAATADAVDEGADEHSALRSRFTKSLPKLLWQLQGTQPSLSFSILHTLLALAKLGDARAEGTGSYLVQSIQAMLPPYFCATRRKNQPNAQPLLGPFASAPQAVRTAACHLLQRLEPLSDALVESLAACACLAPQVAPELLNAVHAAERLKTLTPSTALSFALTLGIEAAERAAESAPKGDAEADALWKLCVTAVEQRARRGKGEAQRLVVALQADAADEEDEGGTRKRVAATLVPVVERLL